MILKTIVEQNLQCTRQKTSELVLFCSRFLVTLSLRDELTMHSAKKQVDLFCSALVFY